MPDPRHIFTLTNVSFIQDCFNIEGIPTTIGFTSFIKNGPMKSNSALVEIIVALGGIPYVKTNIPQTMMVPSAPLAALVI